MIKTPVKFHKNRTEPVGGVALTKSLYPLYTSIVIKHENTTKLKCKEVKETCRRNFSHKVPTIYTHS